MGRIIQLAPVPFQGSAIGTTIPNLQPGNYQVNEIKTPDITLLNELREEPASQVECLTKGFDDGGQLVTSDTPPGLIYEDICFEYEDEQEK